MAGLPFDIVDVSHQVFNLCYGGRSTYVKKLVTPQKEVIVERRILISAKDL